MGYIVKFAHGANCYRSAVRLAKKVSFSLRQSDLSENKKKFWEQTKLPDICGEPLVIFYGQYDVNLYVYLTASGRTRFAYSDACAVAEVTVWSEREDFADSQSARDFLAAGWFVVEPPRPWSPGEY